MPKILARQPRWLDHNSPASHFFASKSTDKTLHQSHEGPLRRIANRGTELFVAVGNEVRWSDLAILKEAGEGETTRYGRPEDTTKQAAYKILKTPSSQPIQQLSVSPSGDFIAVLTSHTCHLCVLPPRENLQFQDRQPLKLRSYQLGPTAHVLEQAPLVSAVWHPLSPSGNGLVTVTEDACVRLWELDQNNRSTFNEPALAVDLKKLANAGSTRDDLSATRYGANKGYSADQVEMQAAGACFGGQGGDEEDGWSSMTLWIAMVEGDVYALCPFLPSKFWAPATLLPSLSTSVAAKKRVLEEDRRASELLKLVAQQQSSWLADLDQQEPTSIPGAHAMDVYSRPERSAIARLQGPFQLAPEPDFGEITDIHVIAPKINDESLFDDEDEFELPGADDGLSIGIMCLATSTSQVHICLNVEGVEAEWLPSKRFQRRVFEQVDAVKDLLLFQTVDLGRGEQPDNTACFPTFTPSRVDRYELFTTQPTGVYSLSVRPWIPQLEDELSAPSDATEGIGFRMNVLLGSADTTVSLVTTEFESMLQTANAAVAILDEAGSDVGYVVLTSAANHPYATLLDIPTSASHPFEPDNEFIPDSIHQAELRAPYQPAEAFFQQSALPAQLDAWRRESQTGASGDINSQILLSPFTLQNMAEAHRILSSETHTLGIAAADLFRRCERMVSEMKAQIGKVRDLSNRINSVTGEDEFPVQAAGSPELVRGGKQKIENRIRERQEKTKEIKERVDNLRKKMRGLGGKQLSAKEKAFAEEVAKLETSLSSPSDTPISPVAVLKMENSELTASTESRSTADEDDRDTIAGRFRAAADVYGQLMEQARAVQEKLENSTGDLTASRSTTSSAYRQQKLAQVFALLERETALVDAVSERLQKLQVAAT